MKVIRFEGRKDYPIGCCLKTMERLDITWSANVQIWIDGEDKPPAEVYVDATEDAITEVWVEED